VSSLLKQAAWGDESRKKSLEDPDWNPYDSRCPECGKAAIGRCRCMIGNWHCADGHQWHRCPVHKDKVNQGTGHGSCGVCTCGAEKEAADRLYRDRDGNVSTVKELAKKYAAQIRAAVQADVDSGVLEGGQGHVKWHVPVLMKRAAKHHHAKVVEVHRRDGGKDTVCPHCGKPIKEGEVYTDAKGWTFHRPCFAKGKGAVKMSASVTMNRNGKAEFPHKTPEEPPAPEPKDPKGVPGGPKRSRLFVPDQEKKSSFDGYLAQPDPEIFDLSLIM
jgi:hypothetical protein